MSLAPDIEPWQRVERVLAVRLDNLGDVLMTTPALAAIRQSVPGAKLTLLTSTAGAAAAACVPEIDDVLIFDAPWVKHAAGAPGDIGQAERELIDTLRQRRFDAAVIFTVCTQSALPAALLCRLAGIPLRLAHCRENPYGLLSHWVPETDELRPGMSPWATPEAHAGLSIRHEVQRQLALVATVGCTVDDDRLRLHVTPQQRQRAQALLREAGVPATRAYFIVHAGASAASRRYPAARFGSAADAIAARSGCLPIFTGDTSEQALIDEARRCMSQPSVALAGRLGVPELAALIGGARLLLANNTGPVHIAAALGTPVTVLYALTNPQHTPWRVPARVLSHDVPCRHCLKSVCPQGHHDCLMKIEPETVVRAAMALLRTAPHDVPATRAGARQPQFEPQGIA
ncbi:MAG: glycosyltransferase family 9 protein [Burkholderiaceae bacterium]|nr:glycosyltransferase family 9 protein [Burkholderiaceae bacterium]